MCSIANKVGDTFTRRLLASCRAGKVLAGIIAKIKIQTSRSVFLFGADERT